MPAPDFFTFHPVMTQKIDNRSIRRYYDRNTALFLALGSTQETKAIHRALWPPYVNTLPDALNVSNRIVHEELSALIQANKLDRVYLADLGCGVGDSLRYHMHALPVPSFSLGVTLSPVQAHLAGRAFHAMGEHSVSIIVADFQALPFKYHFHFIYSIEAFVHAASPAEYLMDASRNLAPGGRLVIVDDFKSNTINWPTTSEDVDLLAYRQGWHVPALQTAENVKLLASKAQLKCLQDRDLTPWLRLRLLPKWLSKIIYQLGARLRLIHPIIPSLSGSVALQRCLHAGLVEYRMLVFERGDG